MERKHQLLITLVSLEQHSTTVLEKMLKLMYMYDSRNHDLIATEA